MRRDGSLESALTALAAIEAAAAKRHAEIDATETFVPVATTGILRHEVDAWRSAQTRQVLSNISGGVDRLRAFVEDCAAARLRAIDDEMAERRRVAAAAEVARVAALRAEAARITSPIESLLRLPRAHDVAAWSASTATLLAAVAKEDQQ